MTRAPSIHTTHQMSSIFPAAPSMRRQKRQCGCDLTIQITIAVLVNKNKSKEWKPKQDVENASLVSLALPISKSAPELKKASPRPPGMTQPRPDTADCCDASDITQMPTNTTAFPHPLPLCHCLCIVVEQQSIEKCDMSTTTEQ